MNKVQLSNQEVKKEEIPTSQKVFKYVCIALIMILLYCLKGFLNFRSYCELKGYYFFPSDSLVWCFVGFCGIFVVKYSYYAFMRKHIEKSINPRYRGQQKIKKRELVLKLSYDTVFYTGTTLAAYIMFRNQYWFPSIVGGCGSCSEIYKEYPDWPTNKRTELQIFFMIQLGVHVFSVFEMAVIKRKTQRKFFEFLLHHFVAATLILFSMMCNQIAAGTMILIVHDASDIFIALGRGYLQSTFRKNSIITGTLALLLLGTWIYMRIIVFPFCLLSNVYINKPDITDQWYIIRFEYLYLLTMAFVLVGMHIYWTYFILKSLMRGLNKSDRILNQHEKIQEKDDEVVDDEDNSNKNQNQKTLSQSQQLV